MLIIILEIQQNSNCYHSNHIFEVTITRYAVVLEWFVFLHFHSLNLISFLFVTFNLHFIILLLCQYEGFSYYFGDCFSLKVIIVMDFHKLAFPISEIHKSCQESSLFLGKVQCFLLLTKLVIYWVSCMLVSIVYFVHTLTLLHSNMKNTNLPFQISLSNIVTFLM